MTVVRDLKKLIETGFLNKSGAGRNVTYSFVPEYKLLKEFNIEEYFTKQGILRDVQGEFNREIFNQITKVEIFTKEELDFLNNLHTKHKTKILKFGEDNITIMKRELERLIIDLAWKSSQIEGNTYTLFETEALLKEKVKAKGKTEIEAIMILNHKKAIDFIKEELKQEYYSSADLHRLTFDVFLLQVFQEYADHQVEDPIFLIMSGVPKSIKEIIKKMRFYEYTVQLLELNLRDNADILEGMVLSQILDPYREFIIKSLKS